MSPLTFIVTREEPCYNNAIVLLRRKAMEFCRDIRLIRQRSMLSQEAFAKILGVSFTTVNRWETGKCKPSYRTMKLIDDFCKARGIDFDVEQAILELEQ